jgi:hypothetical protein
MENDEVTPEILQNCIGAEIVLPMGNKNPSNKVNARKRGQDGTLKGTVNQNLILDTHTHEAEFHNELVAEFGASCSSLLLVLRATLCL